MTDGVNEYPAFCIYHDQIFNQYLLGNFVYTGAYYRPYNINANSVTNPKATMAALPFWDWYYYHLKNGTGGFDNQWTVNYVNAWVQCSVWLAMSGVVTEDNIITGNVL